MDARAAPATAVPDPLPPPQTAHRRRHSTVAPVSVPAKLSVSVLSTSPNGSAGAGAPHHQHELLLADPSLLKVSLPSSLSYTSLKDLLPQFSAAAINSPTGASSAASGRSGYEISIRNRLVKQAAWAYLQPMSASPGSSGHSFLQRLWLRLCSPVNSCLSCISSIARALYRILHSLLRRCSTG